MTRSDDFSSWCNVLERILNSDSLPGPMAQRNMAPVPRQMSPSEEDGLPRQGSVLLLLYPTAGGICLPVTLRSERVVHHKGQISLPGGMHEPEDMTLADTALRETCEEIGVKPGWNRILGRLTPLYVPTSNSCIHPYVACCSSRPAYRPNPAEVAEVIEMPLRVLMDPTFRIEEDWEIRTRTVRVPFYQLGAHKVWGATAMILSELATILAATPELGHIPNHLAC